ncbi:sulfur carrier protein ThiS [Candidatus Margulisiibacteriota bacterium]
MISLIVNGEQVKTSSKDLSELVREHELNPEKIIVEYNGEIYARNTRLNTVLKQGDKVELIQFVGGG